MTTYYHGGCRCFIVPPHILRSIAQHGTEEQRRRASLMLERDNSLRTLRQNKSALTMRTAPGQLSLATAGVRVVEKKLERSVYDAHKGSSLPGELVRRENAPPIGDHAVNEAYDGLGHTHHFYLSVLARQSIDDEGMPLHASVHYSIEYPNAFWDGKYMVFGDGDGVFFQSFTNALDVIGHELTHGVVENEAGLIYYGQPGALNESLADVFGSLIKQYACQQDVHQADWLIGAGLFTAKVQGQALRSMKEPGTAFHDPILGKDIQPAHMNDYVSTDEDHGGVHINSGIPNRAFYLAAVEIGGEAWKHAGRIWYETLRDPRLRPTANFEAFAYLTVDNAERLYGHGSPQSLAISNAWKTVGVAVPLPVM